MKKKYLSLVLALILVVSSGVNVNAMTPEENGQINGNAILIGDYLFELDSNNNSFDLENFIKAARSIDSNEVSKVLYKTAEGKWFDIIADKDMKAEITAHNIDNQIIVKNGKVNNTDPTLLTASDFIVSPSRFTESIETQGTFKTAVTVKIKESNNAKFAENIDGNIDAITSASLVKTAPVGTNMTVKRVDDKTIELKMTGKAVQHDVGMNTTSGRAENQKDFNDNKIYGDIKFLMLPKFFTGVTKVQDAGQYVVLDVIYNDGSQLEETGSINKSKTQTLTIENVDYGVIVLNKGTIDDYNFTINDAVFKPTKVNDSGSVVKFEMNKKEVAVVKVVSKTNNSEADTFKFNTGNKEFTGVVGEQAPDKVLVSGPVSVFDYYLVDYTEAGEVRTSLEKTTFDTENEGVAVVDKTVPKLTVAPKTDLGTDIVITVADKDSVLSKKWMANVYEVLKDYDKSAEARSPLQYRIDSEKGQIAILAKSTAILDRNGRHEIVIKSNGYNEVHVDIELVTPAGEIFLSPNYEWYANNELLFELQNFNYAVTNPVHSVYLDGEKLNSEDYHVVAELIRLKNGAKTKLTEGEHTLRVEAYGFNDFSRTFTLKNAPDGLANPTFEGANSSVDAASGAVDAVSAATGSIATGGGSGGSSGSVTRRANVIYDFDHIANAFILTGLGMDTPYAKKVINWWHSFTKDAAIKNGSDIFIEYTYYKNKVGINGEYTTFEELFATMPDKNPEPSEYMAPDYKRPAGLRIDRPYMVKNMLHDGVLGDHYPFREYIAKEAPSLTVNQPVVYGSDIVISYDGKTATKWAEALEEGSVKVNSNYLRFTVNKNNKTVTFSAAKNSFIAGANNLKFTAEGFKTITLLVELYKEQPANITVAKDSEGNVVFTGFKASHLSKLRGLYLNGKGLFNDQQVGGNSGSYHIVDNQVVLRSKIFGEDEGKFSNATQLTLKIMAEGYEELNVTFTPNTLKGGKVEGKEVPSRVVLSNNNTNVTGDKVAIVVGTYLEQTYKNAITGVKVDGKTVAYNFEGDENLVIDGSQFTEEKDYEITILATDYKDKVVTLTVNNSADIPSYVTFEMNAKSIEKGTDLYLKFEDNVEWSELSSYGKALTEIVVGENTYKVLYEDKDKRNDRYNMKDIVAVGDNQITVKATGYKDVVYTVNVTPTKSPVKFVANDETISDKTLSIEAPKNIKLSLGSASSDAYKDAITAVKIAGNKLDAKNYSIQKERVGFYNNYVMTIPKENFVEGNTYKVTIEATGYEVTSLDIVVKAGKPDSNEEAKPADKNVPDSLGIYNGETIVKDRAVSHKANKVFVVALGTYSQNDYIRAVSGVKVNGTKLENPKKVSTSIGWSNYTSYEIPASYFVENTTVSVAIEANGYKTATFTVTVTAEAAKKTVPSSVGHKDPSWGTVNQSVIYVPSEYKKAITKVVVDGKTIKNYKYSSFGGNLSFNNLLVKSGGTLDEGTYDISIEATGYETYTGQITLR